MVTVVSVPSAFDGVTHVIRRAADMNDDLTVADEVMAENAGLRLITDHVFELAKARGPDLNMRHDREAFFIMMTRVGNNIQISHATDL
jgi:hypothetical protein